jgi:hypothetical protein
MRRLVMPPGPTIAAQAVRFERVGAQAHLLLAVLGVIGISMVRLPVADLQAADARTAAFHRESAPPACGAVAVLV